MNMSAQHPSARAPLEIQSANGEAGQIVDLRAMFGALWRRKWLIVMCATVFGGLAALYVSQVTPLYFARAQVMINTRQQMVANVEDVVSALTPNTVAVESEIEVIRSTQLLERVIEKLRLDEVPEFNSTLRSPGPMAALRDWRGWVPEQILLDFGIAQGVEAPPDPVLEREIVRLAVIDSVRGRQSVSRSGESAVYSISFVSEDPRKAALIANTIADQYIVDQLEAKFEATKRASTWLNERVATLRADVDRAESTVEAFREVRAIAEGQGVELTSQQLGELNSRIIVAQAERGEAQARYEQMARLVSAGRANSAPEVLASDLIQSLRQKEADVQRRAAELSSRYGDLHPDIVNVRAELRDLRGAISTEINKVVEGLRSSLEVARAREQSLIDSVQRLEQRLLAQSETSLELRALERDASAAREIYENFLARFKETTQQQDFQQADARIISKAEPPLQPFSPRRTLTLMAGGMGGIVLGLALVALLEYLNNTYQSITRLQRETGLPVLASLPKVGRLRQRSDALRYVRDKPNSQLAECVRNLRTAILLSKLDNPPQVIMVTSSTPGEGKSTACMLLAHLSAQLGMTAIIVDCDLRHPTLAGTFGVRGEGGLTSVLDGTSSLADAVHIDPSTGLHVLPTRRAATNAADILASQRFADLLGELRSQYGIVLLDTPPTLAVTDARIVGALADAILYIVRWDVTTREAVVEGVQQLRDVGIAVTGAVVTMVDVDRAGQFAESGYGQYGRYKSYYKN